MHMAMSFGPFLIHFAKQIREASQKNLSCLSCCPSGSPRSGAGQSFLSCPLAHTTNLSAHLASKNVFNGQRPDFPRGHYPQEIAMNEFFCRVLQHFINFALTLACLLSHLEIPKNPPT